MAIQLDADPIVTFQECKDILGYQDVEKTTVLINSVSLKFRMFTGRVAINKTVIEEDVRSFDGRLVWCHAKPIVEAEGFVIEVLGGDGSVSETLDVDDGDLVIDWRQGRRARSGCIRFPNFCWCGPSINDRIPSGETARQAGNDSDFPNLRLKYTGGFDPVPGDVVMSAFEQIKLELERLQGTVGLTSSANFNESVSLATGDILDSVKSVWKRYRVLL